MSDGTTSIGAAAVGSVVDEVGSLCLFKGCRHV